MKHLSRLVLAAGVLTAVLPLVLTGCSKPSEPQAAASSNEKQAATATTAAHGTMQAGARNRKHR